MTKKFIYSILTVFTLLCIIFFLLNNSYPRFSLNILLGGNAFMAVLSILIFFIARKNIHGRPEVFVRGVFGATFLKMFICILGILIFVLLNRTHIHKPSIFILCGIYIVYTTVETWLLMKLAKK